jgi:elongation factor Ts
VGHRLAMHIAAARPLVLRREDVSPERCAKEREIITAAAAATGAADVAAGGKPKPAGVLAKMVEGRMEKFFGGSVLLEQAHMLEEGGPPVARSVAAAGDRLGLGPAGLSVAAYARFKVGEEADE